jgi:hypothetical protein
MTADPADVFEAFVRRFNRGKPKPATTRALDALEKELELAFPEAYRTFMKAYGGAYTPELLDRVVEGGSPAHDIQEIFAIKEVGSRTKSYWKAGMPKDVVGFASDCMGNLFCFQRVKAPSQDGRILFFDHDFVTVEKVAATFQALLGGYLRKGK